MLLDREEVNSKLVAMANPMTLFEEAQELLDKKSIPEALAVLNRIGEPANQAS